MFEGRFATDPAPPGPLPVPEPGPDPDVAGAPWPGEPGEDGAFGVAGIPVSPGVEPPKDEEMDARHDDQRSVTTTGAAFVSAVVDPMVATVERSPNSPGAAGVTPTDGVVGGAGWDVTGGGPRTVPVVCAVEPSTESTAPATGAVTAETGPTVEPSAPPTTGTEPTSRSTDPATGATVFVTETDCTTEATVLATG